MRTVVAYGWPYQYRVIVERRVKRGKVQWRYVAEQKWAHWRFYKASRWNKNYAKVVEAGRRFLDNKERTPEGEYL